MPNPVCKVIVGVDRTGNKSGEKEDIIQESDEVGSLYFFSVRFNEKMDQTEQDIGDSQFLNR